MILNPTIAELGGTVRYELLLALRHRLLWYAVAPMALLSLMLSWKSPGAIDDPSSTVSGAALVAGILCTLGIAVALTDRFAAARRPGLGELVAATPVRPLPRAAALLAAPLGAALLPVLAVVLACAVPAALAHGGAAPLAAAAAAFASVVVPGAAAAAALAALLGLLLPAAAARTVVAGLWLWSTIASPGLMPLPTPVGTVFSPAGGYPAAAWFGHDEVWAHRDLSGPLNPPVSDLSALTAIGVQLGLAALFLAAAVLVLRLRRTSE